MFREMNRQLRKLILIIGAIMLMFALREKKEEKKEEADAFPTEEFDDIW